MQLFIIIRNVQSDHTTRISLIGDLIFFKIHYTAILGLANKEFITVYFFFTIYLCKHQTSKKNCDMNFKISFIYWLFGIKM